MLQVIKKCPIRTKNSISHLKVPYRRLTPSAPFPLTTVFAFLQDYGRRNKVNCSDIFADYLLFPANYLTADTTRHLSSIKSCSKIDFMYSFLTLSDLYRQTAAPVFLADHRGLSHFLVSSAHHDYTSMCVLTAHTYSELVSLWLSSCMSTQIPRDRRPATQIEPS